MTERPPMPTGWAWTCQCGWQSPRLTDLAEAEHRRYGHLAWHEHVNTERRTA